MAQSRPNPSESGFTLIEAPVVIPTIGILATIALPIFLSQRTGGCTATARAAKAPPKTASSTPSRSRAAMPAWY
jgi:Tfp pilus assembly major pilin PilA